MYLYTALEVSIRKSLSYIKGTKLRHNPTPPSSSRRREKENAADSGRREGGLSRSIEIAGEN